MNQPNASHGCSQTLLNQSWMTSQHIWKTASSSLRAYKLAILPPTKHTASMWCPYTLQYPYRSSPTPPIEFEIQRSISLQTRHNRPSHSYANQQVFLLQWSSLSPKRRPTYGFQDPRHSWISISGIYSILFMDRLETIALSSHLSISPYKRYVDDIYFQQLAKKWQTNSTKQWTIYTPK